MPTKRHQEHPEADAMHAIHDAVVASGLAVLWRNNCGVATWQNGARTRYGLGLGSADLVGVLRPSGRAVAIEVKSPVGKATPAQLAWRRAWEGAGGLYILARSVEDALDGMVF